MTTQSSALSSAQAPTRRGPWKEIIAASVGNALEFYDLLIYGYFAVVIGKQFFPSDNETTSLLLAVGSFGISFLMRPLGAIVLGSYTDRAGRKASLTLSIMIMLVGTAMITFAPTYEQIGLAAPLLIIVARMLQGFPRAANLARRPRSWSNTPTPGDGVSLPAGNCLPRGWQLCWRRVSVRSSAMRCRMCS